MKRFIGVLRIWGIALPLFATALTPTAFAQDSLTQESSLPMLEIPTATSAEALQGFDNRQTQTDAALILLPAGAGGEQSTDIWNYSLTDLNLIQDNFSGANPALPAYAVVEPNRTIETQTDPERLTIQMQTERGS